MADAPADVTQRRLSTVGPVMNPMESDGVRKASTRDVGDVSPAFVDFGGPFAQRSGYHGVTLLK